MASRGWNFERIDVETLRDSRLTIQGPRIAVRTPRLRDYGALETLLRSDVALGEQLEGPVEPALRQTARQFRDRTKVLAKCKNALSLAIVDRTSTAIGLIWLSHIDHQRQEGQIGYWLGSDYWGQGYGTEAFALALWLSRRLGVHLLTANIGNANVASLRIWYRYRACTFVQPDDRMKCVINLQKDEAPRNYLDPIILSVLSQEPLVSGINRRRLTMHT